MTRAPRKTTTATAPEAVEDDGLRWEITVSRAVRDVLGETFRPGLSYIVGRPVLALLGDAVATREPHTPPV